MGNCMVSRMRNEKEIRREKKLSTQGRSTDGNSCLIGVESDHGNMEIRNEKFRQETKLVSSLLARNAFRLLFEDAVSSHAWELAEGLVLLADPATLNIALQITTDSIWFLSTQQELDAIKGLVEKIIANGAYNLGRAAAGASCLASCALAVRSQATSRSIADTITGMTQRLHDFIQEWNGYDELKILETNYIEVQKCIEVIRFNHSCHDQGNKKVNMYSAGVEFQLQLSTFKRFLDLAGNQLTSMDFSLAFKAACCPVKFFSSSFDRGSASGIWAANAIQDLLGMLVERGAIRNGIVSLHLNVASRLGSTALVRIILKVAQMNNLDVDVHLAFSIASRRAKIGTMECLVEDGNVVVDLSRYLFGAAISGCKPVVEWLVNRGCHDMSLYLSFSAAASNSQIDVAAFLLPHVPRDLLSKRCIPLLKEIGVNSLDGVAFLLGSNFLGDPTSTYAVADRIARSDHNEDVPSELRAFLQEHWSEEAFLDGIRQGQEHYMNIVRIFKWGDSPIRLDLLPPDLRVAIAYLPLYRECVKAAASGCLVSQRLRGQLVEAVRRLGGGVLDGMSQCREVLALLEHHLTQFLLH